MMKSLSFQLLYWPYKWGFQKYCGANTEVFSANILCNNNNNNRSDQILLKSESLRSLFTSRSNNGTLVCGSVIESSLFVVKVSLTCELLNSSSDWQSADRRQMRGRKCINIFSFLEKNKTKTTAGTKTRHVWAKWGKGLDLGNVHTLISISTEVNAAHLGALRWGSREGRLPLNEATRQKVRRYK